MAGIISGLSKVPSFVRRVGEAASKAKPFYSALDEALSGLPNKALGDQFVKDLLKRGVKPQEIIDRNLDQILGAPIVQKTRTVNLKKPDYKGRTQIEEKYFEVTPSEKGAKSVSKSDVEKAAAENPAPQLGEDVLFGERPESGMSIETSTHRMVGNRFVEGPEQHYVIDNKTGDTISGPHESYGAAQNKLSTIAEGTAGFEEHTLPRGTNYREIVIKLPGLTFEGTHYPKGTLAHARVSDRTGPNGEKMLHIEEIQSDLHQKGRKKGYSGNVKELPSGYNLEEFVLPSGSKEYRVNDPQGRLYSAGMSPESATKHAIENLNAGVPDAPFKNNWYELVMKRLLDDAARNGYDKVVMTPGIEQAKRSGQIKKIDRIEYKQEKDGNYYVIAAANDGSELFYKSQTLPELESLLGKDLAEKIATGTGDLSSGISPSKSFNVEGLTLGGEGMKGFYDQMLPAFVNRYGEKTGLRMNLHDTPIQGKNFNVYEDANANPFSVVPEGGSGIVSRHATREEADIAAAAMGTQPLHSINITPEFRASVAEKGQSLYQMAPPAAIGAATSQDQPEESYNFITFRKGGEVNLDAMNMAVWGKKVQHKQYGGVMKGVKAALNAGEEILRLKSAAKAASVLPKGQQAVLSAAESKANLEKFLSTSQDRRRLYHATPANFSEFQGKGFDPTISGNATWLTANKEMQPAAHNTSSRKEVYREGVNVMPVYVQAERPLMMDDEIMEAWAKSAFADNSPEFPFLIAPEWLKKIKAEGYDSIFHPRSGEVIMLEPNKIKSAIGNRGTYDIGESDISKAKGGSVSQDAMRLAVMTKQLRKRHG